ncbi:hypothetical protein EV356DRAFT_124605 [Viridothelium virens]|uniref:Lytic polysaccharide monooxygenase n=1 Tax=Viridothelium virens TaxID=1048519 RepID=A0A6A6HB47_VIRVR|nr:hypothetical protein EV356DRAFT_124605 [Viridothelium virens]
MLFASLLCLLGAAACLANPVHLKAEPRGVTETYEIETGSNLGHFTTATTSCSDDLPPITTVTDVNTGAWLPSCRLCYPPYSETWTIATSDFTAFQSIEKSHATILTPHDTFSQPSLLPPRSVDFTTKILNKPGATRVLAGPTAISDDDGIYARAATARPTATEGNTAVPTAPILISNNGVVNVAAATTTCTGNATSASVLTIPNNSTTFTTPLTTISVTLQPFPPFPPLTTVLTVPVSEASDVSSFLSWVTDDSTTTAAAPTGVQTASRPLISGGGP